ncbi:hypothetical protein PBV88_08820, partial [Streptomyces sp. T21Q-yed]|nr:hypothetical protein [Streptomyces sp. T21Q-yed]
VAALTELSRRDRLAEGFASRLGERPACDLLEEPGAVDEAASLLAARLFHGGPAESGQDWSPVDWQEYPEEVVDRKWRMDAARLHRVLDALGVRRTTDGTPSEASGPTLARVMEHLSVPPDSSPARPAGARPADAETDAAPAPAAPPPPPKPPKAPYAAMSEDDSPDDQETERSSALAAGLTAELAREEAAAPAEQTASPVPDSTLLDIGALPLFPLQPPRTARELLTDHVTAMVCCAAMDTAGAAPGLDWLDGPTLLIDGERAADLTPRVLSLIEDGDPVPLRAWLVESGIRPEKPVRLV